MFNTYVINTKTNSDRWYIIKKRLQEQDIHAKRFDAITPSQLKQYTHKISLFGSLFCPTIAKCIGLSHLVLLENIYYNDPHEYALILEDDAVPVYSDTIQKIQTIIQDSPPDWDIIKLYWFFYNKESTGLEPIHFLQFSNAAYLIHRPSILKIINSKVYYHIDLQFNLMKLNILKSPMKIFETYEEVCSTNRTVANPLYNMNLKCLDTPGNKGVSFWLSFKALHIPGVNFDMSVLQLVMFFILCILCLKF